MSILKYKYKAHKFINYAFYVVIFIVGFLLGFGAKEINFNKLISQVLMIENVSAYEIVKIGDTTIDEEFIYNEMFNDTGYDISNYPYISCSWSYSSNSSIPYTFFCFASPSLDSLYINVSNYFLIRDKGSNLLTLTIKYNHDTYIRESKILNINGNQAHNVYLSKVNTQTTINGSYFYTNFDFPASYNEYNEKFNKLDFSSVGSLEYNPNLFKDDENFKEVCVDKNSKISIISNNYTQLNDSVINYEVEDFMWFDTGIKVPGYIYDIDNDTITHTSETDENNLISWNYYFNNKVNINKYFNENVNGAKLTNVFNNGGYGDKNNYYGYTAIPFYYYGVKYLDGSVLSTYLSIHDFSKIKRFTEEECATITGSTVCIGNSGTPHGGGGIRLPMDEEVETEVNETNNICFYIKNEYEVVEYEIDEWGDINADFEILGGNNISIDSSIFQDNADTDSLFGSINTFLKKISTTLELIKDNVYNFYLSMPLLLRLFIISFFTILIIKFIIGMVVR